MVVSPPERPSNVVIRTLPPAAVLLALGLGWLVASVWNFVHEFTHLAGVAFPLFALALTGGVSVGVVYAGLRLSRSEYTPVQRWTVVKWSLAGLLTLSLLQGLTFAIRLAEGRTLGEPQFPLLVTGGAGAIAGALIGVYIVRARNEAREARTARDAMAFTNSLLRHDVKNGLQIIVGHGELVAESDDEDVRESGETIVTQVESLLDVIGNANAVSDVLEGDAEREVIDLSARLQEAVETARDSFPRATIREEIPDGLRVRGTDALEPVFTNLLNNAVQHTGAEVTVAVTAADGEDTVEVTVADDGPGIPPADRERIFDRGVTTDGGSNGLGLHIVATLLERSGGDIRVEDSDLGGAAFVVELPAA